MINEYYGAASTPTEDYIAHYGIKGMKWGVKRALSKSNDKSLARQYKKAQKMHKMNLIKSIRKQLRADLGQLELCLVLLA